MRRGFFWMRMRDAPEDQEFLVFFLNEGRVLI